MRVCDKCWTKWSNGFNMILHFREQKKCWKCERRQICFNMVTASFNTCQHSWKDRSNSPNICSNKCWANVEANVGTVWTSLYAGVTADIDPFSRIWTPPHTKTLLLPSTESRTRNKCDMTHPFTFWNGDIHCLSFRAMHKEVTSFPSSRPAEIFHRKKLATQKCCIS